MIAQQLRAEGKAMEGEDISSGGRGRGEPPRQGMRSSRRSLLSAPFVCSECRRSGKGAAYHCELQWCLEPGCPEALQTECSHRRKSGGAISFAASPRRPIPKLFCVNCFARLARTPGLQRERFSKVQESVWEKVWKLSVYFQPLGSDAPGDGLPERFDVLQTTLSDLVERAKETYPATRRLLTIKEGGDDEVLWEAFHGGASLDANLHDVLGGDDKTVYVDCGGGGAPAAGAGAHPGGA